MATFMDVIRSTRGEQMNCRSSKMSRTSYAEFDRMTVSCFATIRPFYILVREGAAEETASANFPFEGRTWKHPQVFTSRPDLPGAAASEWVCGRHMAAVLESVIRIWLPEEIIQPQAPLPTRIDPQNRRSTDACEARVIWLAVVFALVINYRVS